MAELKNNIDKFFSDLSSGTTWNVGVSIARKNAFPLDNTSVFKSYTELTTYAANGMSYMGQPVAVVNEDGSVDFYVLDANKVPQEVGKATVGDDKSIVLDDGVLKLFGFDAAEAGAQLTKGADGTLSWVVPSTETVEGLQTTVQSLKDTVNGTADKDGLVKKVADNATAIAANTKAIETLNGDATKEGSVAYQIAQIVEANGEGVDTLKEIAAWIADHPTDAAEYNARITANEGDISSLKTLVGSTAVATQIENKIKEALFVDDLNKYALASELTALAGRVSTAETKITTIETELAKGTIHSHANKTELDKIVDGDVAKWNETVSAVDTIETELAKGTVHKHANKETLDKIGESDLTKWNSTLQDAKTYTEGYAATKAQGATADSALQSVTVLGKELSKNGEVTLTPAEAKTALGLKSAAYAEASDFDAAGTAAGVKTALEAEISTLTETVNGKTTLAQVNAAIADSGHATEEELTAHTSATSIHVTEELKNKWNTAADLVDNITGGQVGGITNTINDAIATHKTESEARYDAKYATIVDQTAIDDRLKTVETESAASTADVATLKETTTTHTTKIADAESAITTLQGESALHAAKTYVDTELGKKVDATAYNEKVAEFDAVKAQVDAFFADNAGVEGTIDTLKDIAEYIKNDTTGASGIAERIGALEGTVGDENSGLIKTVNAEITRSTSEDSRLSGEINTIKDTVGFAIGDDGKSLYATISDTYATKAQLTAAKTEVLASAETDATTKVNELANGAVASNTGKIATNSADIITLQDTKANTADVYNKTETYTKAEVEALIAAAENVWGQF